MDEELVVQIQTTQAGGSELEFTIMGWDDKKDASSFQLSVILTEEKILKFIENIKEELALHKQIMAELTPTESFTKPE